MPADRGTSHRRTHGLTGAHGRPSARNEFGVAISRRPFTSYVPVIIAAAIVVAGPKAAVAFGHGPCPCLDPRVAEADGHVRVGFEVGVGETRGRGYPAYRVSSILTPTTSESRRAFSAARIGQTSRPPRSCHDLATGRRAAAGSASPPPHQPDCMPCSSSTAPRAGRTTHGSTCTS